MAYEQQGAGTLEFGMKDFPGRQNLSVRSKKPAQPWEPQPNGKERTLVPTPSLSTGNIPSPPSLWTGTGAATPASGTLITTQYTMMPARLTRRCLNRRRESFFLVFGYGLRKLNPKRRKG